MVRYLTVIKRGVNNPPPPTFSKWYCCWCRCLTPESPLFLSDQHLPTTQGTSTSLFIGYGKNEGGLPIGYGSPVSLHFSGRVCARWQIKLHGCKSVRGRARASGARMCWRWYNVSHLINYTPTWSRVILVIRSAPRSASLCQTTGVKTQINSLSSPQTDLPCLFS